MPLPGNCSTTHPERQAGPCSICNSFASSYTHLHQKKNVAQFCSFVAKEKGISEYDCICKRCELRLKRQHMHYQNIISCEDNDTDSPPAKIKCSNNLSSPDSSSSNCFVPSCRYTEHALHTTVIQNFEFSSLINMFELNQDLSKFSFVEIHLCHPHYCRWNKKDTRSKCLSCDKKIKGKVISISDEQLTHYISYVETQPILVTGTKPFMCLCCYNKLNKAIKEKGTNLNLQDLITSEIKDINNFYSKENIDMLIYREILLQVYQSFQEEKPVLLSSLYKKYLSILKEKTNDIQNFVHSTRWLCNMLKLSFGPYISIYTPDRNKKAGRMLYKTNSNIIKTTYDLLISDSNSEKEEECDSIKTECSNNLNVDVLLNLKKSISVYTSTAIGQNQDIDKINIFLEIKQIDPLLWNTIFYLTASSAEEKEIPEQLLNSKTHYIPLPEDNIFYRSRLLQRLFIISSIFNTHNSQCSKPLHLLITDIADKYSNSSTDFLTILSRIGIGVSKDTHKRFISDYVDKKQASISEPFNSFAVCSFDNIDKNQIYSSVSAGKTSTGFHGTSVQVVEPLPKTLNNSLLFPEIISNNHISGLADTVQHYKTDNRNVSASLLKSFYEPVNQIGTPISPLKEYGHLSFEDFKMTENENNAWEVFLKNMLAFSCSDKFSNVLDTSLSQHGIKYFFSLSENTDTFSEKSKTHFVAVLDEKSDDKETILKILNLLFSRFQVGTAVNHIVMVGDGKSYDILMKLKFEYGEALKWLLIYPGDWHILKNVQPVLFKIYYEAGLKDIAKVLHAGARLKALSECTRFPLVHNFLLQVWEALSRLQLDMFQKGNNDLFQSFLTGIDFSSSGSEETDDLSKFSVLSSLLASIGPEFQKWRELKRENDETFRFWDSFIHIDFPAYFGLYIAIRSRNWHLRMASLKQLSPLFHAFDRPIYLKLLPYHLADLLTFPITIIDYFSAGAFSVSITGKEYHNVALDEAHEMQINLQTKNAMNAISKQSLASLCLSLPFRAEVLQNLKEQILLSNGEGANQGEVNNRQNEEKNVQEYVKILNNSTLFLDSDTQSSKLHHIFSGQTASREVAQDMLNFRKYGEEDYKNYVTCVVLNDNVDRKICRKRRNLKSFLVPQPSQHQQKKEIKDSKTVIACLRKQLAYSKLAEKPVSELNQFIKLPRAICTPEGLPEKGDKSSVVGFFKSLYPASYKNTLSFSTDESNCVILEGMFIINSRPLGYHNTFVQYASFLYDRWGVNFQKQYNAQELHIVFDDPNRNGTSPKDIERNRRDSLCSDISGSIAVSDCTPLPSDWQQFLSNRSNKRKLITYLSLKFLELAKNQEFLFVTAGGFEDRYKDKAICMLEGEKFEYSCAYGNHEEGDSRVWLHASATPCNNVLIYSPDTDVCFIGLPLIVYDDSFSTKKIFIQLKDSKFEKHFVFMNSLCDEISNDLLLQNINNIHNCFQNLFIFTGCDYLSFFKGFTKRTAFDTFRKNCKFISGDEFSGSLSDINDIGILAFYRLIGTLYFNRHRTAFPQSISSARNLFLSQQSSGINNSQIHLDFLQRIREKIWDRIVNEEDMMPTAEALKFHWQRGCWVADMWRKAVENQVNISDPVEFGWEKDTSGNLSIIWDTDENFSKVENTVLFLTKGCKCKTGCSNRRCICKKKGSICGPGCSCTDCTNMAISGCINMESNLGLVSEAGSLDVSDGDVEEIENIVTDEFVSFFSEENIIPPFLMSNFHIVEESEVTDESAFILQEVDFLDFV